MHANALTQPLHCLLFVKVNSDILYTISTDGTPRHKIFKSFLNMLIESMYIIITYQEIRYSFAIFLFSTNTDDHFLIPYSLLVLYWWQMVQIN